MTETAGPVNSSLNNPGVESKTCTTVLTKTETLSRINNRGKLIRRTRLQLHTRKRYNTAGVKENLTKVEEGCNETRKTHSVESTRLGR
ncbi:hypothetical protein ElyMa_006387100 [Elysia marginata]|uniref:Uncharacterized protein n=1 Tax=Elysia marginata TaxID=1093978 RepID=A0AAV4HQL1_9GAST|nr:hypothetical protein ElyMa_006387100 [Elysia marginata]